METRWHRAMFLRITGFVTGCTCNLVIIKEEEEEENSGKWRVSFLGFSRGSMQSEADLLFRLFLDP